MAFQFSDQLKNQLAEIGAYDIEEDDDDVGFVEIRWEAPGGLSYRDGEVELCFSLQTDDTPVSVEQLQTLVNRWPTIQSRLNAHYFPQFDRELVKHFRAVYEDQLGDFEREEMQDDQGNISDDAILEGIEGVTVILEDYEGKFEFRIAADVDWDIEHGAAIGFDEDGNPVGPVE